jgi:hypothetical protein
MKMKPGLNSHQAILLNAARPDCNSRIRSLNKAKFTVNQTMNRCHRWNIIHNLCESVVENEEEQRKGQLPQQCTSKLSIERTLLAFWICVATVLTMSAMHGGDNPYGMR